MNFKNLNKLFLIVSFLFLGTLNSYAQLNGENWQHLCGKEDKNNCLIGIKNFFKNQDTGKNQKLATAYILIGTSSKQGEVKTSVPVLFIDLPLNVDLRKNPLVLADGKNIGNITFMHCNQSVGCKTNLGLNSNSIELLKKSNELSVLLKIFGQKKNFEIKFPLKGFTKSYNKLSKE
ncbi:invasion associated locus B family protein [Candidatus Pelagibacter sp.]|nr:invasion associated locus B family protein [Candidatus Pelagibacter sp.]